MMSFSILVVDDEADVVELFRQQFRREVGQGAYAMHFARRVWIVRFSAVVHDNVFKLLCHR